MCGSCKISRSLFDKDGNVLRVGRAMRWGVQVLIVGLASACGGSVAGSAKDVGSGSGSGPASEVDSGTVSEGGARSGDSSTSTGMVCTLSNGEYTCTGYPVPMPSCEPSQEMIFNPFLPCTGSVSCALCDPARGTGLVFTCESGEWTRSQVSWTCQE